MSEEKQLPFIQFVRGFPVPLSDRFPKKNFEDAMDMVPEDGDLIVASYPKTGTTWMQYIALQILSRGKSFPSFDDLSHKVGPFVELVGVAAVLRQTKPRFYKHHIAYNFVQKNEKSKVIYTYRHPEDVVVSLYHFLKKMASRFQLDFNQFIDGFVSGKIGYGCYFRHFLSFYEHKNDPNLLMVSYEKLQANRKEEILRVAKFLGEEHHHSLLEDEELLDGIMHRTSFDYMKKNLTFTPSDMREGVRQFQPEEEKPKVIMSQEQKPFFQIIRGFPCPVSEYFSDKNIEEAMDLVPEDSDVIVASYPKTGTTWMQYILLQITSRGESFPPFEDVLYKVVPYVELSGVAAVHAQDKPRFYKHHFPYNIVHRNDKAKTIYTYRHPEDTIVSFFHFRRDLNPNVSHDFDKFFEHFAAGNVSYGSYFQHVLSFYEHREDNNLLMVSYEKLHANRKEEILRIANFLGEEHYQLLQEDKELLDKIILHTSFNYMKKNLYLTHPDDNRKINFFRKGVVGDGKVALSSDQRQTLKKVAEKVLAGTSIVDEWYGV